MARLWPGVADRHWWLVLLLLWAAAPARAEVPVPPLRDAVTDLTGTLTAPQRDGLDNMLQEFAQRNGSQIAVLILPTTRPETIEQYAIRVAEQWKLGREGVDDGVLLVVAKDDHELRIEVGYGLEGAIPDAIAKRVISEIIVPHFTKGDFYGGIRAGVERLMGLIEGEPLPSPPPTRSSTASTGSWLPAVLVMAILLGGVLRSLLGAAAGGAMAGGTAGIAFGLLAGSVLGAILVGLFVFLFTLGGVGAAGRGRPGGYYRGGGFGGSAGGGGFSGGSFGGGGFSGGGGSFGGGGASGRW